MPILVFMSLIFAVKAQSGAIRGKVKNKEGQPLSHARVMLVNKVGIAPCMETATDDKGIFSITNLPSGQYNVMCMHEGYLNKVEQDVAVSEGGGTHLDIILEPYIHF